MTITSTAPVLSSAGISAPTYAEILDYLQVAYRGIYGADIYLGNDSQDGQLLAIFAASINDANSAAIAVYNAFSPTTAQGNGLASVVKVNGITKAIATNSTVDVVIVGVAGSAITNGVVMDAARNRWGLPPLVNIPGSGTVTVTATCQTAGAVAALPNTVNQIITPQLGWQTVTNPDAAILGAPVESDAALRQRQAVSVMPAGTTRLVSTVGAVAALPGVTRYWGYENPTGTTDANGLPEHSIAIIVEGGSTTDIAQAIANYKTEGCDTYGTTSVPVNDIYGLPITINYFQVEQVRITLELTLTLISGYTDDIGVQIKQALANYVNALAMGQKVIWTRLFQPANLNGSAPGLSYEIDQLLVGAYPASPAQADVIIAFNAAAHLDVADVNIIFAP